MGDFTNLSVVPDVEHAGGLGFSVPDPAHGTLAAVGLLRHGATSGRASVGLKVVLDDGTEVVAETTWRLLRNAVRALAASPVAAEEVDDL